MKDNIKKYKSYIIITLVVLLIIAVGFTAAYFQAQVGSGASANVTVTTKTTDALTFSKGNDISITATQANFGSGAGNKTGSTTASATLLANNDTNSATQTYNVYLLITNNNFVYTTDPTNTPELMLTITNPNNQAVTSLTGLTYTTSGGVSGFDITTKKGLIQIAGDYSITSTGTKTDTWNVTVSIINLNSDQQLNTEKTFTAQVIIQKNTITATMLDTGANVNSKFKNMLNYGESNEYPFVAFKRADSLPNGFVATINNTISVSGSNPPIYIWLGGEYYKVKMGDTNGDGSFRSADWGIVNDCVNGLTCYESDYIVGDCNKNGVLDTDDIQIIIQYKNEIIEVEYTYLPTSIEGASAFASYYGSTVTMGTIYFYSEADIIYLNDNSSSMYDGFYYLRDIDHIDGM